MCCCCCCCRCWCSCRCCCDVWDGKREMEIVLAVLFSCLWERKFMQAKVQVCVSASLSACECEHVIVCGSVSLWTSECEHVCVWANVSVCVRGVVCVRWEGQPRSWHLTIWKVFGYWNKTFPWKSSFPHSSHLRKEWNRLWDWKLRSFGFRKNSWRTI